MRALDLCASLTVLALVACEPAYYPRYYESAIVAPVPSPASGSTAPVTYKLQNNAVSDGSGTSMPELHAGGTLVLYDDTAKFEHDRVSAAVSRTLSGVQPTAPPGFGYPNGVFFYEQTGTGTPRFELERMGPALGLKASDFGAWTRIDINKESMTDSGFYAGGLPTSPLTPASAREGTSAYVGSYVGRLRQGDTMRNISGSMLVQVDHGNNTVTAVFTSGPLAKSIASAPGELSGDTYTASYSGGDDHAVHYVIKGQLYQTGDRTETTGTLSGAAGETNEFEGAFGGHT